jgi:2,4-dienoyl-CoA reductase-like NADH-dependent reductase (Old Yellow Enzyme family)
MALFTAIKMRDVEFKNRIVVSPMCEYSAVDGHPQTWHLVHLGSRAVGGAGLVFTEASAVQAVGRISGADTGIYLDAHVESWRPVTKFIREHGAVAGMQLAHSGRKGSTSAPWLGGRKIAIEHGGWEPVAPSALAFAEDYPLPRALSIVEIDGVVADFRRAAERALAAGFEVIEIHSAHGYLLHEFLSPPSNVRTDEYGGSFENRVRLALRVVAAVREVWPQRLPLFYRVSATDWVEDGWNLDATIALGKKLKGSGFNRCVVWRKCGGSENSSGAGVSSEVCGRDTKADGDCYRGGGNDNRCGAGGHDSGDRPGGYGFLGAATFAGSVLAAAGGEGAGGEDQGAGAV